MCLPALRDLRAAYPDALVTVAARAPVAPLFAMLPDPPDIVTITRGGDAARQIRAGAFDAGLLLPNAFGAAWTLWRAGVPERWGYATDLRRPLLTRAVRPPSSCHQVRYYQHLTTSLGCEAGAPEPRLVVTDATRAEAAALLRGAGWQGEPLVAIAPGAAFGGAKRWPAASFAATLVALSADGVRAVLVGSAADAAASFEVLACAGAASRAPIDLTGQTTLAQLAGVLTLCQAVVSNDSGAMHVAAALGLPVTAIFGPTNADETAPRGSRAATVLHGTAWCRPCMLRECPLTQQCMRQVSPDQVVASVRSQS